MAAILPAAFAPYHAQVTVTGAAGAATLLFDGTQVGASGLAYWWELQIQNLDADAGDGLYVGFTATTDTGDGFYLDIFPTGTAAVNDQSKIVVRVPPHTQVYANCTAAETRDVRILATPFI